MLTREQRLKDREVKRILHEEELARIEELQRNGFEDDESARRSERQMQTEVERRQQELDRIREEQEQEQWTFDCAVCGLYGQNLDDGFDSVECERCQTWQHSACYGLQPEDAQREDFHFVCTDCKRKDEFKRNPKLPPLKLNQGSSPKVSQENVDKPQESEHDYTRGSEPNASTQHYQNGTVSEVDISDGPSLSPTGQSHGPPGYHPNGQLDVGRPQPPWDGPALPPPPRPVPPFQSEHQSQQVSHSMPPPQQLHMLAHESAVSTSDIPHERAQQGEDRPHITPAAPRPERALSSGPHMRLAQTPTGPASSPTKPRPLESIEPVLDGLPRARSRSVMTLTESPGPVFAAGNQDYDAQVAGHSPVKQPSSSPQAPASLQRPVFSPVGSLTATTPVNHGKQISATPTNSVLRASGHMASSPLPPLGNGQVIPQKHDTPRQLSHDGIGGTAVVPPSLALSPTAIDGGKGMSVETGLGGLGQGNVPVKKSPTEGPVPGDVSMHSAI